MKNFKKIIVVLLVFFVLFSAIVYIDYFIVVNRNSYPKISLKKDINDDLMVYNAILYRVWYCKLNGTYTIGDYSDKDAICSNALKYDKNGNYTNANGVMIEANNMKLISDFYSYESIGNMSGEDVENALYVIENAYKVKYRYYSDEDGDPHETHSGYLLVQFPEYKLNSSEEYAWVYNEEYYCINDSYQIALYDEEAECGTFKDIGIDSRWCSLYKLSNLSESKIAQELCKE